MPYLDYLWFRDERVGRIAQNIGGIANLTAIAAGVGSDRVLAFDTGPGNMVIDAVTQRLFRRAFDDGGRIAATGKVIEPVLTRLLTNPFFAPSLPRRQAGRNLGAISCVSFLACAAGHASKTWSQRLRRSPRDRSPTPSIVLCCAKAKTPFRN